MVKTIHTVTYTLEMPIQASGSEGGLVKLTELTMYAPTAMQQMELIKLRELYAPVAQAMKKEFLSLPQSMIDEAFQKEEAKDKTGSSDDNLDPTDPVVQLKLATEMGGYLKLHGVGVLGKIYEQVKSILCNQKSKYRPKFSDNEGGQVDVTPTLLDDLLLSDLDNIVGLYLVFFCVNSYPKT